MSTLSQPLNLQRYNSTTYVDQLALQLGLYQQRLPEENAASFLDRLYAAARSRRDHHVPSLPRTVCHLPDPLPANRPEQCLTHLGSALYVRPPALGWFRSGLVPLRASILTAQLREYGEKRGSPVQRRTKKTLTSLLLS